MQQKSEEMELNGAHVLITGAAKRVGRTIADRLLNWNIQLTIHHHHSRKEAQSLVKEAQQKGRKAQCFSADLRKVREIKKLVDRASKTFGPVQLLINSASVFAPTPALECKEQDWDNILDTNLKGQFYFAQACRATMKGKGGLIINLADTAGEKASKNYGAYSVSKAGLIMLTKNLAKEWAPKVRVNCVSPGPILVPESYTAAQIQKAQEQTLLKRLGTPDDIAKAILFLIDNDYLTGFNLIVDGGRSLVF